MKIEAGKEYRTAHGLRARVYAVDVNVSMVHGAYQAPAQDFWNLYCWLDPQSAGDMTLVAEWGEPNQRLLAWIRTTYTKDCNTPLKLLPPGESPGPASIGWRRAEWLDEPVAYEVLST